MITKNKIQQLAQILYHAHKSNTPINQFDTDLNIAEAYQIQEALAQSLLLENNIIGYKMGLTNRHKMKLMNVNEPLHGYLFSNMLSKDGTNLYSSDLIQPKVEMEIAFKLRTDLSGLSITPEEIINATEYITPALEIVDSRFTNFNFTFTEGIADNICAAKVIFGQKQIPPTSIDLSKINARLCINEEQIVTASSSSVLDNPIYSIIELVKMLYKKGDGLKAGQIIISGAMADAVTLTKNSTISAQFDKLGTVSFNYINNKKP